MSVVSEPQMATGEENAGVGSGEDEDLEPHPEGVALDELLDELTFDDDMGTCVVDEGCGGRGGAGGDEVAGAGSSSAD